MGIHLSIKRLAGPGCAGRPQLMISKDADWAAVLHLEFKNAAGTADMRLKTRQGLSPSIDFAIHRVKNHRSGGMTLASWPGEGTRREHQKSVGGGWFDSLDRQVPICSRSSGFIVFRSIRPRRSGRASGSRRPRRRGGVRCRRSLPGRPSCGRRGGPCHGLGPRDRVPPSPL